MENIKIINFEDGKVKEKIEQILSRVDDVRRLKIIYQFIIGITSNKVSESDTK